MNFIVTGGLGFIGSHVSSQLLGKGEVTIVDNLHTGKESNLPQGCNFIKGNSGQLKDRVNGGINAIFHQGIFSSAPMYKQNVFLASRAVSEFGHLMEFARVNDAKVVVASTSSLYRGIPGRQKEDVHIEPFDFYTKARYKMEKIAEEYSKNYGMKNVVLRYFSVYGPGEAHKKEYANLISQFIWAMERQEGIEIYGDGRQERDFIYIADVVEANMLALEYGDFGIFNVGTGNAYSLNQVMGLIEKLAGKKIKTKNIPNPIDDYVEHTLADTAKAEKLLGFRAETDLETGIRKSMGLVQP
ncbi:NAD-dependent epimerase/dehydratase family protein [Candidatus Micrarchaeota archaeon]|nr:NAD-dependent epimerase/dehydratase family protein [Candidatus Micrarchaeota archaeon]